MQTSTAKGQKELIAIQDGRLVEGIAGGLSELWVGGRAASDDRQRGPDEILTLNDQL